MLGIWSRVKIGCEKLDFVFFCLVVPHVTDAIQRWVQRVAETPVARDDDRRPDVCVIEVSFCGV